MATSWRDGGKWSGAWRDPDQYVDRATAPGGAQPALHMTYDYDPAGSRPPAVMPRSDIAPPAITDDYDRPQGEAPGLVLDRSPDDDHSHQGTHTEDLGGPARQTFRRPAAWQHDHTRDSARYEIPPISAGSAVGVLRGANALAVNNPEGYPLGHVQRREHNRRLWAKFRRHDLPELRVALATSPGQYSPPMTPGNRYTSPFDMDVSSRFRTLKDPILRRVPRPWDEDLAGDGTEPAAPAFESWGL
ncbi:MAG: hypothetical protein L0Y54_17085 [Sporichthyaceae bacterium]|nr:hypothetical protein [Sporichthyaceae bacterium]